MFINSRTDGYRAPFAIGKVDLTTRNSVCKRVSDQHGIDAVSAEGILSDLITLLSGGVAFPHFRFRPTRLLDVLWHELILHTKGYIAFCNSLGCDYIHHNPQDDDAAAFTWAREADLGRHLHSLGIPFNFSYQTEDGVACSKCMGCDNDSTPLPQMPTTFANIV